MVHAKNWVLALATVTLAATLAGAGCGSEPATKPPTRADASRPDAEAVIGGDDGGTVAPFDGGIVKDTARMLNVVGDPAPTLEYGEIHSLTALLVSVGVGAVPNEPVTFVLEGPGMLDTLTAQTNAAGLVTVQFTAPKAAGTSRITASSAKVAVDSQAVWIIKTVQPVRVLVPLTATTVTLASNAPTTIMVRLEERNQALAGGSVAFAVMGGSRGGAMLNHKAVDTDTVVTGIDGVSRLALSVSSVAADYTFSIQVTEQYSTTILFKVMVKKDIACTKDTDCRATERCNTTTKKCEPKPQCTVPTDCNAGFTCSGGQCVPNITCNSTAECAAGWTCDTTAHECVQGQGCTTHADCAAYAPKSACDPVRHICVYPTQILCGSGAACPTGYHCDGVRCVSNSSSGTNCSSSVDCPMGEYCNPNTGTCTAGCDSNASCSAGQVCNQDSHSCVQGCSEDYQCFPQVCDPATGQCMDAPAVIYDVSGTWNAVQTFHVAGLTPPDVQSALSTIDTIFTSAQAIVDCHVSQFLPGWLQLLIGSAVDDAVCGVIGDYVPDWVQQVAHIGADVSNIIEDFEIHSVMNIMQPGAGQVDRHTVSGVDDWKKAYFFWYTTSCKTPKPGAPPPDCARVEVDLVKAAIAPSPSQFTGRVDDSTLHIDTHNINFKFGKAVLIVVDALVRLETNGKYLTLQDALAAVVDCVAVNSWIQGVVEDILGPDLASWAGLIDVTGACNSAKNALIQQLLSVITGLNADVPMSLVGKAGVVLLPGNTSNVADRLAPGIWYGKFNGQGDDQHQFGEWYADRP